MKRNNFFSYVKNIILPCLVFSLLVGCFTGIFIMCYKWTVSQVINLSAKAFEFLRANPLWLLLAIPACAVPVLINSLLHKIAPQSKGGGIANALAFTRGLVTFKWLRTLIATTFSSLMTFLFGTPLGNEGPSVLAGAAIGKGVVKLFGKNNRAWDRYAMTGGACAGFAVATNAPISGVLFSIEEAHHRISPMIIMVAGTTVAFAVACSRAFANVIGVDANLFHALNPITLTLSEMWIPLLIGALCGLLSVLFIKTFELEHKFLRVVLKKIPATLKMFITFAIFVLLGFASPLFIGTGHSIIDQLFVGDIAVWLLVIAIVIRIIGICSAKNSGITGGTFIPVLALGAIFSSLIARLLIAIGLITADYYQVVILIGMSACFSGMTKTPLTAVAFAIEALALASNVLHVLLAVIISYMMTELFNTPTVNELSIEAQVEEYNHGKQEVIIDTFVTVKPNSFVVNKAIRDILWPNNLFVLSIKHADSTPRVDEHGEALIKVGDMLHVRYSTFDKNRSKYELLNLVGEQDYVEYETRETNE